MKSNILITNWFYFFNNWIPNITLFLIYIHKPFFFFFIKWKRSQTSIYIFRFINSCIDQNGRIHVARPLVLYVCFVDCCLSFWTFSFGHCVVCSSIYGFWLPLWNLQALLINVVWLDLWTINNFIGQYLETFRIRTKTYFISTRINCHRKVLHYYTRKD